MLVLSVTTLPSRIQHFLSFYHNIMNGSLIPDQIILNVYKYSLRGDPLIIPETIGLLPNVRLCEHEEDYGPILKFMPFLGLQPDDILVYGDDDMEYHKDWMTLMVSYIQANRDKICAYEVNSGLLLFRRLKYLNYNGNNTFLRGFGGVGCYVNILSEITKADILTCLTTYEAKLSDDLIISYLVNKYGIPCMKIKAGFTSQSYLILANKSDAISQGAGKTIASNKNRYFNICKDNPEMARYFTFSSLLSGINDKNIFAEFNLLKRRLETRQYFTFVRFGDSELNTVKNILFTDPNTRWKETENFRRQPFVADLRASLTLESENYYIGIPCGCNEDKDGFRAYLWENYTLPVKQLTFASPFNNRLYPRFQKELVPLIKGYPLILVSNEKSDVQGFQKKGYQVKKWFPIPSMNAWEKYADLTAEILAYTETNKIKDHVFIFCAGPLSNIMAAKLHVQQPGSFYLDFGSAFDRELGLETNRNYLRLFSWKILAHCYWTHPTYPLQITCSSRKCGGRFTRAVLKLIGFLWQYPYVGLFGLIIANVL
jgi:hypothetical protein